MSKKKTRFKTKKYFPIFLLIFIPVLILLFSGIYFLNTLQKASTSTQRPQQKLASESARVSPNPTIKPKSTPIPILIPPQTNAGVGEVPILTYHYIANNPNPKDTARDSLEVPPDKFEEQMQYFSSNGYTSITLDTMYAIFAKQVTAPTKPIVLTFDDGYIDFYTIVYPILRKYNFHAVSFIPTGLIGGSYYMNWSQIKEIQSSGLVNFEDHTVIHANLVSLNYSQALKQMVDSKNILQSQTGYPVNFIAYPYGTSNGSVQAAARQAGFVGGLGTWYGKATGPGMNMPRIKVSGYWSIKEFAQRL